MMRLSLVLALAASLALPAQAQPNTLLSDSSGAERSNSSEANAQEDLSSEETPSLPTDLDPAVVDSADVGEAPGRLPSWLWPVVGGALGLVLIVGGGWYVWQRKNAALSPPPGYRGPDNRPTGAQVSQQAVQSGTSAFASSNDVAQLWQRVQALEQTVQQLRAYVQQMATPAPVPVPASTGFTSEPPPPAATRGPAEQVGEAFAAWCRTRGPLVNKHDLFANDLATTHPGATLEVVHRDLDSPARPVYFDATGGNSAAAYWLVRLGGDLLLFPQPLGPQQFRDLAPVFEGHAAPQSVQRVEPARVAAQSGGFVLTQPGRVA